METLIQDLRYGARMLLKHPGFTLIAVITLALGIGANAAIFSVVNSVLLKPLAFEEPDRLVKVWEKRMALGRARNVVSPADYFDWKAQNAVFEEMAAYSMVGVTLGGADTPELIGGGGVSTNFFSALRSRPAMGRLFHEDEDQIGRHRVAIISHGLWKRRFGSDPNIIDKPIIINGNTWTIVGIMPASFTFPDKEVELWVPLTFSEEERNNRGGHFLDVIARLKPGVTLDRARQDMEAIATNLESQYQVNTGHGVNIFSLYEEAVGDIQPTLWILFGAVGFVLLIACANVANLLLARAAGRQKEIAVRTALGAGRLRIVRQLLTESVLLFILSGVAGGLLAMWGLDLLLSVSPDSIPRVEEIRLDLRVLGFTLLVSLATGIVFGLVPALQASKFDLNEALKEGGRGSSAGLRRNKVRSLFVIAEVAVCLVLLVGAGLMIRSFVRLINVDSGFNPENVLTVKVSLGQKYRGAQPVTSYFQQTLERLSTVTGVERAGAVLSLPLSGGSGSRYFAIEGRPPQPPGQGYNANLNITAPGYFNAIGIPMKRGRDFNNTDAEGAPEVAIINEEMARLFWPDEDPIGGRIRVGDGPWRTIVGIVGNVKYKAMDADTRQEMYWPYYQTGLNSGAIVVRTKTDPKELIATVRSVIMETDKDQPLYDIKTMEEIISESVAGNWLNTLLLGVFGGTALIMAAVGLYGVISCSVAERTHEIGIRMALGANSRDVLRLVVGQGMLLAVIGIAIGIGAAIGLTQFMKSLLFGVKANDPMTFAAIALLLAAVAMLACWIPARRATRVDPMIALRYE